MGKSRKLKKQAKKHGKALAKKTAAGAVAAKALKEVGKDKPEKSRGGVKKVVLTAGLLAGGYVAAKKLGLLGDDEDDRPTTPPVQFDEEDMP